MNNKEATELIKKISDNLGLKPLKKAKRERLLEEIRELHKGQRAYLAADEMEALRQRLIYESNRGNYYKVKYQNKIHLNSKNAADGGAKKGEKKYAEFKNWIEKNGLEDTIRKWWNEEYSRTRIINRIKGIDPLFKISENTAKNYVDDWCKEHPKK